METETVTPLLAAWALPTDWELWLLVGYLILLWLGAWLLEVMAKVHFHRAHKHAHASFQYDRELDQYECPQGERLTLHTYDDRSKLAIYKAPAASCNECVLKSFCTPHDEGRHVYRSLAEFQETDAGLFHQWLSLVMFSVTVVFAAVGVVRRWSLPGEEIFLVMLMLSVAFLWWDLQSFRPQREVDSAWDASREDVRGRALGPDALKTEPSELFGGEG